MLQDQQNDDIHGKPTLAITMGDPAGIGPEIIAKAWQVAKLHHACRPIVLGHPDTMRKAIELLGADTRVIAIDRQQSFDGVRSSESTMPCVCCVDHNVLEVESGRVDARGGEAAYQCIRLAADLAQAERVDGMVTAPINKAALAAAGYDYPGHTELLADLCEAPHVAMMLYLKPDEAVGHGRGLGVAHVTLHVALRKACDMLSVDRIFQTSRLAHTISRAMLRAEQEQREPIIGVCALNPHAGENGLFGDEEQRLIQPAVSRGRAAGLDLHGPHPADTLMARAVAGQFDAIVAMYHDQGHIALKLLTMHRAVNITLGLPVIRTSVAHGTAFDRAWQGTAECASMVTAIDVATKLISCRHALQWT